MTPRHRRLCDKPPAEACGDEQHYASSDEVKLYDRQREAIKQHRQRQTRDEENDDLSVTVQRQKPVKRAPIDK